MDFRVRLARSDEVGALPGIERSAAEAFRGSAQDHIADDEVSPVGFYRPLVAAGLVWAAELDGVVGGFAACESFADALHIWELAVARAYQGRGLGRALIEAAAGAANARGLAAVTLTTFSNIPWNAPFYARLGFRMLDDAELPERLRQALAREAAKGLSHRCAMRLAL